MPPDRDKIAGGHGRTAEAANAPSDAHSGASKGRLFVVSAPSGAGKTTLCEAARRRLPDLVYSVSSTTRSPRHGEADGKDYFFVSEAQFRDGIEAGQWLEWARVHGNYYGTSARFVADHLRGGRHVLLDIDVQGAAQIVKRCPAAVTIFIMPPSMVELRRRLTERALDSPDTIETRLQNAAAEIAAGRRFRHVVVNDDLEAAADRFVSILSGRVR